MFIWCVLIKWLFHVICAKCKLHKPESTMCNTDHAFQSTGSEPPGFLQVPPPPSSGPAGQTVPDFRHQASWPGPPTPRPGPGHNACHAQRPYDTCQRQQHTWQSRHPLHPRQQPRHWGEYHAPTPILPTPFINNIKHVSLINTKVKALTNLIRGISIMLQSSCVEMMKCLLLD